MPRRRFDPGEFAVLLGYGLVLMAVLLTVEYRRRMRALPEIGRATARAERDDADAEHRETMEPSPLPMSER
jgi:heme exporter protein D